MNPLTFVCSNCQNSIGVAPEYAGMPVACPHCKQVVMAPAKVVASVPATTAPMDSNIHSGWQAVDVSTANLRASQKNAKEREDSIFSDPEEGDDEALFGLDPVKKSSLVEMPDTRPAVSVKNTPHDLTQPTQRVPGLAASPVAPRAQTPAQPVRKLAVTVPDSKSFAGSLNLYPSPPKGSVDAVNPFMMEAAIPTEFAQPDLESNEPQLNRRAKAPAPATTPNWKLWIIIGLAAYSFLITIVAIWGWMRSTQYAPVKHDTPATQKAKAR